MNDLQSLVARAAKEQKRPDGSSYTALTAADEQQLADSLKISRKMVQAAALERDIVPERYSRNQQTLSCPDQLRLLRSHIVIVGLGGLGGTVTEILARIGIGTLTLIDGDCFEESNLNRQLLSSVAELGRAKAEVAHRRVEAINPAVEVHSRQLFFSATNGAELLAGAHLAVDCLDTITDRFVLEKACQGSGIPLVSAAIGGTTGQATTIYPDDAGLRTFYGDPRAAAKKGLEASLGTLPFTAVYMAAVECAEAITLALGRPPELRNRLLLAEVADHSQDVLDLDPPGQDQ